MMIKLLSLNCHTIGHGFSAFTEKVFGLTTPIWHYLESNKEDCSRSISGNRYKRIKDDNYFDISFFNGL